MQLEKNGYLSPRQAREVYYSDKEAALGIARRAIQAAGT